MTAQARLTALFFKLGIPGVAVTLVLTNPPYMSVYWTTPLGMMIFMTSLFFLLIGSLIIGRMTDVKVG